MSSEYQFVLKMIESVVQVPGVLDIHQGITFFAAVSVLLVLIKLANKTDIPKIKGLSELPGVPVFGSLFLLGKHHARNCAKLAKSYGDVFQVRLGNRVSWDTTYKTDCSPYSCNHL